MTIFDLQAWTLKDYRDFVGSFVNVAEERLREFVRQLLEEEQRLGPGPLVQLSPAYRRDATVERSVQEGLLHPETGRIFRRPDGRTYHLYRHQVEAIRLAVAGRSFVLTSETGSGKTFCYFIPIVDAVVRRPGIRGPVAYVVYPMNALVNSQLQALRQLDRPALASTATLVAADRRGTPRLGQAAREAVTRAFAVLSRRPGRRGGGTGGLSTALLRPHTANCSRHRRPVRGRLHAA